MTSDNYVEDMENLRRAPTDDKWSEVLKTYSTKRELRTAKITPTGDTVLHVAVSSGNDKTVANIVDLVCGQKINDQNENSALMSTVDESGNDKDLVLGAENEKGNTPLHLAASKGNVKMCKKIASANPSLTIRRNKADETPLYMAALHGNRIAFLWLYHLYKDSHSQSSSTGDAPYKKGDNDTILHGVIAEGHIDFVKVIKKKKATTREELEQHDRQSSIWTLTKKILYYLFDANCLSFSWTEMAKKLFMGFVFLILPLTLEILKILPGNRFHGILTMKEKHTWSRQITDELLQHVSDEDMSANPYEEDNGEGSKIIETPLMIAVKNGVVEMVEKILQLFPSTMNIVNEDGMNIVLLAVEKRQTKVYESLCAAENLDKSLFRQVDKNGNTALHLAAKPGINLNWKATTMVEEFKWFEFVKESIPSELWEMHNNARKTAEEIFMDSYKEQMTRDREWLNQTSEACSVVSTLIASMAFANVAINFDKKNCLSLVALSFSLTSTISFLAILAFRSQSLNFWRWVPFMLHIAIFAMFGSIVSLWISLMIHDHYYTTYAILGLPIAFLTIISLPIFIGPMLMSMFAKFPAPSFNTTSSAIRYRRPQKKENGISFDSNQRLTPSPTFRSNDPVQDIVESSMTRSRSKTMEVALQTLTRDMLEMKAQLTHEKTSPATLSIWENSNMATKGGNMVVHEHPNH